VVAAYRDAGVAVGQRMSLSNVGRLGNGDAQFTSIEIEPVTTCRNGDKTLGHGEDLAVRVGIIAHRAIANSIVDVVIFDGDGQRLVDANSQIKELYVTLGSGESASIGFVLKKLMLKAGTYSITLWIGRTLSECYDHVEHAGTFEVAHDPSRARVDIFPGPYTCDFDARLVLL
jgi:hypothetical protein